MATLGSFYFYSLPTEYFWNFVMFYLFIHTYDTANMVKSEPPGQFSFWAAVFDPVNAMVKARLYSNRLSQSTHMHHKSTEL